MVSYRILLPYFSQTHKSIRGSGTKLEVIANKGIAIVVLGGVFVSLIQPSNHLHLKRSPIRITQAVVVNQVILIKIFEQAA